MTMGLKRMQGLGWVALVFLVAISLYPLSLKVGAMHAKLVRADHQIVEARREISYLQAEIRARASLDQLERWNDLLYGYDAPRPGQYVDGVRELADFSGEDLGPQSPVMVSAAYGLDAAPIGTVGNGGRVSSAESDATSAAPVATAANDGAVAKAGKPDGSPENAAPKMAAADRAKRVAQLENSLLGASTLRDLQARAAAEKSKQ